VVFVWALVVAVTYTENRAAGEKLEFGPNRVINGSFEGAEEQWSLRVGATNDGPVVESKVEVDASTAKTGVYSLRMSGDSSTTKWYAVESEPIPVSPGKRYKFAVSTKYQDVNPEPGQYHNCNAYIQFRNEKGEVVPIGGSPVRRSYPSRGTRDWTDSFAIVVAPVDAAQARVGVTLTCSGTAWFDDVSLYESEGLAWIVQRVESLNLMYAEGGKPSEATAAAVEDYVRKVCLVLDIVPKEPVAYYKYNTIAQKTAETGNSAPSHLEGGAVHAASWDEREDLVLALMLQEVGDSTLVLAEGVALYVTAEVEGRDIYAPMRELIRNQGLMPITKFIDPTVLAVAPRHVQEAEFGSFIGYLIQRFGVDKFKRFYAYADAKQAKPQVPARYKEVYGTSLEEGEKDWAAFLQSGAPRPEPEYQREEQAKED